jgi:uncharacterized protein YecA (UPF0149 family)
MDYGFETWIPEVSGSMDTAFEQGVSVFNASYIQIARETNSVLTVSFFRITV